MKYTYLNFLCFFFLFGVIGSCTITKRVHNPGWHVEWRSNHSSSKDREAVQEHQSIIVGETKEESVPKQQGGEMLRLTVQSDHSLNFETTDEHLEHLGEQTVNTIDAEKMGNSASFLKEKAKDETLLAKNSGEKRIHPLSIASLVGLILSAAFLAIGTAFFPVAIIGAFLLIPTWIFAMIAWKKIKWNPEKWSGRNLTLNLVIISSILFGVSLFYLYLLYFLEFNSSSSSWGWL